MNRSKQLNDLFLEWENSNSTYENKFMKDGIINEEVFDSEKSKILFIAKEPNDPTQNTGDFREWWSTEIKYNFSIRISEWAYGILNDFPPIAEIPNDLNSRISVLSRIAFMNLKKIGGGSRTEPSELERVIRKDCDFIQREIEIINPHIIVGGIGDTELWKIIFPTINLVNSGNDITIGRFGNYKIISFYHPSYRVPRAMTYYLLKEIINSNSFLKI